MAINLLAHNSKACFISRQITWSSMNGNNENELSVAIESDVFPLDMTFFTTHQPPPQHRTQPQQRRITEVWNKFPASYLHARREPSIIYAAKWEIYRRSLGWPSFRTMTASSQQRRRRRCFWSKAELFPGGWAIHGTTAAASWRMFVFRSDLDRTRALAVFGRRSSMYLRLFVCWEAKITTRNGVIKCSAQRGSSNRLQIDIHRTIFMGRKKNR